VGGAPFLDRYEGARGDGDETHIVHVVVVTHERRLASKKRADVACGPQHARAPRRHRLSAAPGSEASARSACAQESGACTRPQRGDEVAVAENTDAVAEASPVIARDVGAGRGVAVGEAPHGRVEPDTLAAGRRRATPHRSVAQGARDPMRRRTPRPPRAL